MGEGETAGRGILLTGATGFLGGEVLVRLLERHDEPVFALVRADDDPHARARLEQVLVQLLGDADPWRDRVVAVRGDVSQPDLGIEPRTRRWLAQRVRRIVHCAASVSFTLGLEESRAVNVEGTRRLLDLAEDCTALDALVHVSTAYVAGTHRGRFGEEDFALDQGFRNPYERSKFEAELLVRERSSSLPVQVVRPSIVVGDSRTGWTPAFNVLYWPLRAFARGAYHAVPARRGAPLDVVPVDYVADAIVALAGRPGTTYHLTAGERTSTIGELLTLSSARFGRRAPFVLPPSLYRRFAHPLLLALAGEKRRRALRASEAFFPYSECAVRYDNRRARSALSEQGIEVPRLKEYFGRLVEFALEAKWGRALPSRHEAFVRA